ncbi:MAG TPA: 2Fe-2S iron-sulfur cluster-binding protein [Xanthobacteraceae bacterium]
MTAVVFTINGREVSAEVEPRTHLADFIREAQNLTGTHLGCEHGVCGACTVLLDGAPVRSCITYAVSCNGASVTTIEGLDQDEIASELRAAFSREHALQCGYCTPGMLIAARDVVLRAPAPGERDIRVAMSGNLCRCTGYVGIVAAVGSVIARRRARGVKPLPGAGRTALGPVGSGHGPNLQARDARARTMAPAAAGADGGAEAPVQAKPSVDFVPQATLDQSFLVHRPVEEVWRFFADTAEVAACLPGASITGDPSGRVVAGKMRIKVGPIAAEFHGSAEIERDPLTRSGTIRGSGRDRRSNSTTQGVIRYRLLAAEPQSTRVELGIGYRLTGMLAQFGRSELVRDIASRLIELFARNLEDRLAGRGQTHPPAELGAASLLFSALAKRVGTQWRRLLRKNGRH